MSNTILPDTASEAQDAELLKVFEEVKPRNALENEIAELDELVTALQHFDGERVDVLTLLGEAEDALSEAERELQELVAKEDEEDETQEGDAEEIDEGSYSTVLHVTQRG